MNVVEYMVDEVTRLAVESVSMLPAPLYCMVQAEVRSALALGAFLRDDQLGAYEAVTDCLINQVLTGIEFTPSFLDHTVVDKPLTLNDLVKLNSDVAQALMRFKRPYTFSIGVRQAISILGTSTIQRVEERIKLIS